MNIKGWSSLRSKNVCCAGVIINKLRDNRLIRRKGRSQHSGGERVIIRAKPPEKVKHFILIGEGLANEYQIITNAFKGTNIIMNGASRIFI